MGPEVDERAGAKIFHDRNAALAPDVRKLAGRNRSRETHHAIIPRVRPVGRPDLTQAGAAAPHDVRDTELAPDLDELSPGDDDFFAGRKRFQREQHRGRVVVHDERVLGAAQPTEHRLDVAVAGPALLRDEIELEVRVRARDAAQALDGERAQKRAAEIRMEHDAGGVDDGPKREEPRTTRDVRHPRRQRQSIDRGAAGEQSAPLAIEDVAHRNREANARDVGDVGVRGQHAQKLIDGGQVPEGGRAVSAHARSPRLSRARAR